MKKPSPSIAFKNWAGNIQFTAPLFAQPHTETEIIELVKQHKNIRIASSAHSWSNHFSTQELLLNLDYYQQVIALDTAAQTITVQSGIKLWQLNAFLDKHQLALSNLGSIDKQSIAGVMSTGTHGTGKQFQCLASQVLRFSIIAADGTKYIFTKDSDEFNAAIINLGTLGIISEVTLQLCSAFNLKEHTYTSPFHTVIENLDQLLEQYHHFKIWWLPPSKNVVVFTYQRTQDAVNDSRLRQIFKDEIVSVIGYRTLVFIGNLVPSLRPRINALLTSQFDNPLHRIEKSFKVFRVPEPPKHRETEWAFDLKDAKEILTNYQKLFSETSHTFNFIQEIRFTQADNFWLSECYQRNTIWIGAYNHYDSQWENILHDFETFAQQHSGRPHWGKEFTVNRQYLEKQYEKLPDFIQLKQRLDPEGKFSNELMQQLFGV